MNRSSIVRRLGLMLGLGGWIGLLGLLEAAPPPSIKDGVGQELVLIEGGAFVRGLPYRLNMSELEPLAVRGEGFGQNEMPDHVTVISQRFYLGKYEVSVGEFERFVLETGYQTETERSGKGLMGWSPSEIAPGAPEEEKKDQELYDFQQKAEFSWKDPGFDQSPNHPVVGVSWNDAMA